MPLRSAMALVQLTCVSSAAREPGPADLDAILEASVRRNCAAGVR